MLRAQVVRGRALPPPLYAALEVSYLALHGRGLRQESEAKRRKLSDTQKYVSALRTVPAEAKDRVLVHWQTDDVWSTAMVLPKPDQEQPVREPHRTRPHVTSATAVPGSQLRPLRPLRHRRC